MQKCCNAVKIDSVPLVCQIRQSQRGSKVAVKGGRWSVCCQMYTAIVEGVKDCRKRKEKEFWSVGLSSRRRCCDKPAWLFAPFVDTVDQSWKVGEVLVAIESMKNCCPGTGNGQTMSTWLA